MYPEELRYHKEHTWAKADGKSATIGITHYAQEALGDIVYIDIPDVDATIEANSEFSEIESTKATSSVIAPVSGTIVKINEELSETPEVINEDPYGKGWIAIVEMSDDSELDELMESADYVTYIEEEGK
jgi:glycine cleavage system H protein